MLCRREGTVHRSGITVVAMCFYLHTFVVFFNKIIVIVIVTVVYSSLELRTKGNKKAMHLLRSTTGLAAVPDSDVTK